MGKAMRTLAIVLLLLSLAACLPADPVGSRTVTLLVDGETRAFDTDALTVRDLLDEASVSLDDDDRVEPVEPTFIEDGMAVRVIRVEVRTETEQREIPFERRTVREASIPAGETRLLEPGATGVEELAYRILLEDGVEVERRLVRQVTIQEPRTEVILIGVQAERGPVPITGTVVYIANRNAWAIQTISSNQHRLTDAGDLDSRVVALSPDGSYLLFTRVPTSSVRLGGGDEVESAIVSLNTLWMIETATADAESVRLDAESVLWAGWEPTCRAGSTTAACPIAYSTGLPAEGNPGWKAENDLWIARLDLDTDGAQLVSSRRLVEPSAGGAYGWWGTAFAWSGDGRRLAYARADEVGVFRASDGRMTVLARFPPYRTYAPWVWTPTVSWSPEGDFVVVTLHGSSPTGGEPEDSPVFDVWALAADGTITAELVSEAGMWAAPSYAPEGDYVAFGRARSPYVSQSSGYDLYLMDRDGSDRRLLFPPEDELGLDYPEFVWGPGGDRLIIVYQGNLYLITIADDQVRQLTDEGNVTAIRWQW